MVVAEKSQSTNRFAKWGFPVPLRARLGPPPALVGGETTSVLHAIVRPNAAASGRSVMRVTETPPVNGHVHWADVPRPPSGITGMWCRGKRAWRASHMPVEAGAR